MKRKILMLLTAFFLVGTGVARAQMTDDAILAYVAQAVAAGKSESQIGSELLAKGVSTSQVKRLLARYQSQGMSNSYQVMETNKLDETRNGRKNAEEQTPDAMRMHEAEVNVEKDSTMQIYGHDIFTSKLLSFEPNVNAATPADYVLGPGDEIIIDIWGLNEATIKQTISPEGRIIVSQIGAINLSGLTIKQASDKIKKEFSKRYAGIGGASPASQISVTLGQIRSIQVSILDNVNLPGTYRLSSFTNVFNAIYRAGGVTPSGSLRAVKVLRGGEPVATVDIYSFLFTGSLDQNVSLKEGDVIIVPPYRSLVKVEGGVKRPMFYEMADGETVQDLLDYAGGFTGQAYRGEVSVTRYDGLVRQVFSVPESRYGQFVLKDGDELNISVMDDEESVYTNRLEVRGAVYRPGFFELGGDIASVKQLVEHAGGLLDNAFLNRAQLIRERPDRTMEIRAIPIGAIVKGTADDVLLRKNDILIVSDVREVEPKGDLTITGYVANPGKYEFAEGMSVEDLILLAGGLTDGASAVNVEVSRRIIDPTSTEVPDEIAQVFNFDISNGLMTQGEPMFTLRPFDVVSIRKSPSYIEQRIVSVTGEVTFPGQYTLTDNDYRVSELIARAGGATRNANVHGAMLKRKMSQYERNVRAGISRVAAQQDEEDSIKVDKLKTSEIYAVGLELDKALAHPGSDYDIILRDGDELIVPENTTTVRIQGEVMYPNTVHYISGRRVGYYVRQAGGYSLSARRHKTYVLYMNGTVATGLTSRIEPGCEIIVPKKPERLRMSPGEILSLGSSAASIAAVVATIVNIAKP